MSLDAIFKAYDVRGLYPEELNEALARRIGNAFAHFTGAQQLIEASGRHAPGYRTRVLSRDGKPLRTSSGLRITPDCSIDQVSGAIDTLIIAGGYGHTRAAAPSHGRAVSRSRGASAPRGRGLGAQDRCG